MKTKSVNISLIMKPSALIPLAMSLAALTLILVHAAIFGVVHEADEGTAAHVFQILMASQIPVVAYFAFKYLPRQPGQSLKILALQAGAWIVAIASVYWLT
jgi:hypothetical protein